MFNKNGRRKSYEPITVKDGTTIYYKDCEMAPVVTFPTDGR